MNAADNVYAADVKEVNELMKKAWATQKSMLSKQPTNCDFSQVHRYLRLCVWLFDDVFVLPCSRVDKRLTPQAPHRTVRAPFTHTAPHSNIRF